MEAPEKLETCWDLLQKPEFVSRIPTGDPILDGCLGGGIRLQGITEVCGEAGSGKTLMCLQLALSVQLSLRGDAIVLYSEDEAWSARLEQLAVSFSAQHREELDKDGKPWKVLDHVRLRKMEKFSDLMSLLEHDLAATMEGGKYRLVVLDSMTSLFRAEHPEGTSAASKKDFYTKRSKFLAEVSARMKSLSHMHKCAFVVVNQVNDCMTGGKYLEWPERSDRIVARVGGVLRMRNVEPALGLAWANCLNAQIQVAKGHLALEFELVPAGKTPIVGFFRSLCWRLLLLRHRAVAVQIEKPRSGVDDPGILHSKVGKALLLGLDFQIEKGLDLVHGGALFYFGFPIGSSPEERYV